MTHRIHTPRALVSGLALALGMALPAAADDLVDRGVAASEVMMGKMVSMIESCAPSLRGQLGDGDLTPQMREAAICQIEAIRSQFGNGMADEYVSALEDYSVRDFANFREFAEAAESYEILDSDDLLAIAQQCDAMEASMSNPVSQAMGNNPMALQACFEG